MPISFFNRLNLCPFKQQCIDLGNLLMKAAGGRVHGSRGGKSATDAILSDSTRDAAII